MITTFETMCKISFELSNSELEKFHSALNSAYCSVMEKRDDKERPYLDRQYYAVVCNTLEKFVSYFNPENFDVKELQQISEDGSSC